MNIEEDLFLDISWEIQDARQSAKWARINNTLFFSQNLKYYQIGILVDFARILSNFLPTMKFLEVNEIPDQTISVHLKQLVENFNSLIDICRTDVLLVNPNNPTQYRLVIPTDKIDQIVDSSNVLFEKILERVCIS